MTASYALEWLNLLGRCVHVVAGIAWIGASFYFIWLDNHLQAPVDGAAQERGVGGELWAVHGGGFYHAQKYRAAPPQLPAQLHWFKWEAYTTLLSGLFLLAIVYYARADLYLVDPSIAPLSPAVAVLVGIAWIAGGWLAYDALCRSALGRSDRALAVVLALLCAAAAYALCHLFTGRAAFLHFGAMLGTVMVLNVFFIIIPGQRALVLAAAEGRAADPALALRGKQRSVHNTYFTLPVVFTMLCNHYAWISGAPWNWLWLIAISAAGALIRAFFVARHRGRASPWPLLIAAALLAATAYGARPRTASVNSGSPSTARAHSIVAERCSVCHAATPRFAGIATAPKGVELDDAAKIRMHAARIRDQVAGRAMPPANVTGLTDAERSELLAWVDSALKSDGSP
ncbi:MAG: urate hydroxylase PuuD [Usitatibacter sp.]